MKSEKEERDREGLRSSISSLTLSGRETAVKGDSAVGEEGGVVNFRLYGQLIIKCCA